MDCKIVLLGISQGVEDAQHINRVTIATPALWMEDTFITNVCFQMCVFFVN